MVTAGALSPMVKAMMTEIVSEESWSLLCTLPCMRIRLCVLRKALCRHVAWRLKNFGWIWYSVKNPLCTSEGYCDLEHQLCQGLVCELQLQVNLSCEEACIPRCVWWMDTAIWNMLDCCFAVDQAMTHIAVLQTRVSLAMLFEQILLDTGAEEFWRLNYVLNDLSHLTMTWWFLVRQQVTLLTCRIDQQGLREF